MAPTSGIYRLQMLIVLAADWLGGLIALQPPTGIRIRVCQSLFARLFS